ncbi:MAG: photosynthetic reaction center subunit H [Pseudomonadota bacterium]
MAAATRGDDPQEHAERIMDFSEFDFVNLTNYIDLAQVLLYVFWLFFGFLLFHLQAEGRREGYPLESDETGTMYNHGLYMPEPKTFLMPHGHGTKAVPDYVRETRTLALQASEPWSGAPKDPTSKNPMLAGVGPGAYAERLDTPDIKDSGEVKIRPMSSIEGYAIPPGDPNPIGSAVMGMDQEMGGTIVDAWVDQAESVIRYWEIQVAKTKTARTVLLPANFAIVRKKPELHLYVDAIKGQHFKDVPKTKAPDQITLLEEDKIMGYYGSGYFYADAKRPEPLL